MKNDEILIVQDYLRITFGNEEIQIRKSENEDSLNSIFINNSRIGNIFRDIDPDDKEVTYTVSIPISCLLYTSPSPRDGLLSRMPSSA